MATVTYPSGLRVQRQDFGQKRHDLTFSSGDTGAQQTRLLGPPQWTCSLIGEEQVPAADAAAWRSLILSLDGRSNLLEVYDLLNTAPLGTARGTWTAGGAGAVGATSLAVSCGVGQAGKTILKGDWFGVNQATTNRQLLHVQADVTLDVSGNGVLTFKPGLRVAVAIASAIAWDKPTCLMRQDADESSWVSMRPRQGNFSLQLVEGWA